MHKIILASQSPRRKQLMEMAELQMLEGKFAAARFCMEEGLLGSTHNHALLTLYGEVLFSLQDEDARSYFAQSLVVKPRDNVRAAWGLLLATSSSPPVSSGGATTAEDEDDAVLDEAIRARDGSAAPPPAVADEPGLREALQSRAEEALLDAYADGRAPRGMADLVRRAVARAKGERS